MVEQKEFTAPAEHRVLWKTFKVSLRETGHSTDPTPEDPGLSSQPPHSSLPTAPQQSISRSTLR